MTKIIEIAKEDVEKFEKIKFLIGDKEDRELQARIIKAIKEGKDVEYTEDVCKWIEYDYRTMAPSLHDNPNPYWRIPLREDVMQYCPYCGKPIEIEGVPVRIYLKAYHKAYTEGGFPSDYFNEFK